MTQSDLMDTAGVGVLPLQETRRSPRYLKKGNSLSATRFEQVIQLCFDEMPSVTLHTVKRTDRAKRFIPFKDCSSI